MKGSIVARGNSYRVMVSYQDVNGKRRQITKTAPTLPKAEIVREKLLAEVEKGIFTKPSKMTLQQHLGSWLDGYVRATVSPRTHELYSYLCKTHIIPAIGDVRLCNLRPQHVQKFYADQLAAGLSPRSVQLDHVALNKALSNAVRTGLIPQNPCLLVDKPKVERREMKTMSENDIANFLNEARKTEYYSLFYTLLFTGMRRGEALALRWGDVDLLGCQLSVNRTMIFTGNKVGYKSPKTASSRRQIALSPSTCVVLRLHKEHQNSIRGQLKAAPVNDTDLVFCQYNGKSYLPNAVTHNWSKLIRKSGLTGIRLHDARHTHASLLLKSGTSPKVIQERLGHSTFNTTMNFYAHLSPGMQKQAAANFDNLVVNSNSVTIPLPSGKNDNM